MEEKTLEQLLEVAKTACSITWDDADTKNKIEAIVESAVVTLAYKLGMGDRGPETFLKPGQTKTLFENYCLYAWNKMLAEFDTNYKTEILQVRHKYEVENAKKENKQLQ